MYLIESYLPKWRYPGTKDRGECNALNNSITSWYAGLSRFSELFGNKSGITRQSGMQYRESHSIQHHSRQIRPPTIALKYACLYIRRHLRTRYAVKTCLFQSSRRSMCLSISDTVGPYIRQSVVLRSQNHIKLIPKQGRRYLKFK